MRSWSTMALLHPILREMKFVAAAAPCLTELRALMQRFPRFNGRAQSGSSVGDARSLPLCALVSSRSSIPHAWTCARSITQVSVRFIRGSDLHIYKLYELRHTQLQGVAPLFSFLRYFPEICLKNLF